MHYVVDTTAASKIARLTLQNPTQVFLVAFGVDIVCVESGLQLDHDLIRKSCERYPGRLALFV
jgi:hypothetical protein